jgi:ribosomal protein S18 acetylase RimI-like enzyme
MALRYTSDLSGITARQLEGFFEGWDDPPSAGTHLDILRRSTHVVLALDETSGKVVGFVNALSDGVLSAYVPLLEVKASYRGRGIGNELVRILLEQLGDLYMVDLACDPELAPFYQRFGMISGHAMLRRSYAAQSGRPKGGGR